SCTLGEQDGNEMPLNAMVEWDSAFRVNPNGTGDTGVESAAANSLMTIAENTCADEFDDVPEAVTGHSGQHGYSGPIMHPSEQLGGGMASDVLDSPGTYMLTEAQDLDDRENLARWGLRRRDADPPRTEGRGARKR